MFKPLVIAYVPPPKYGFPAAFLTNLQRYKTRHPLILFSDHADQYKAAGVPLPMIPILNPEQQKDATYVHGEKNNWSVNNIIFLTALRIALRGEYSHILYLEEDCRVNQDAWDGVIYNEYLAVMGNMNPDECIGGSIVCFGPYNYTRLAAVRWEALVSRNMKRNFPIPTYGSGGSLEEFEPIVLVNGALGIYPMALMAKLFDLENTAREAAVITAWDFEIGRRIWKIWKEGVFDHVLLLQTMFSTYGNRLTTEEERKAMLSPEGLDIGDGRMMKVVAAHQFKSEWPGPVPQPALPSGNLDAPPAVPFESLPASEPIATSPTDPRLIVASDESKALTPETDAGKPLAEPVPVAPVQTRKDGPEPVASDKQAPVPSAPARARPSLLITKPTGDGGQAVVIGGPLEQFDVKLKPFKFRVDILIVTHGRDAKWLALALKSIGKFCREFGEIVVVFPKADIDQIHPVLEDPMTDPTFPFDIRPITFDQAQGKGHLHHMAQKCMADLHCPDADLICHVDSDCFFHLPTTPEDYFHSGKPVLLMTPYDHIRETHRGHYGWKHVTEAALKEPVHYSTMERHPAVHWRELYPGLRTFIELKQGMKFEDYVLATAPQFPYGWCEFTSMGAFALRTKEFVEKYHFINTVRNPRPVDHLIQFWSHSSPDEPQKAPTTLPTRFPIEADGTVIPRPIINAILEGK